MTVEYDKMWVRDLRQAMADKPVAYLPIGCPEMHGEHLTFGQDGIKAHELCKRMAERGGGVVLPALHVGTSNPSSFNFGNIYISMETSRALYTEYLLELARVGFRVIIALTGHYPGCQVAVTKHAAVDAMNLSGAWIAGLDECELVFDHGYIGDHAGKWETSMYWHLRPDLVRMDYLPEDLDEKLVAAGPEDPRIDASPELGAQLTEAMVERMTRFVDMLVEFDQDPVQHGPTHSVMRNALRAMAEAYEDTSRGPARQWDEYQRAADLFCKGEFGPACHALASC